MQAVIEAKIVTLENEAALLTGKDNKKERAAKGKEVAELKAGQQYVDACKIVKGLEPKFGYFVTKEAVLPDAPVSKPEEEETKVVSSKKETKKESAGLSPAETKELESLKQQIIERKAILKEQGMSGGQQNKDEEIVKMVARMNELKEKQEPGSTKKEKDGKKDRQPSSLLQAGSLCSSLTCHSLLKASWFAHSFRIIPGDILWFNLVFFFSSSWAEAPDSLGCLAAWRSGQEDPA